MDEPRHGVIVSGEVLPPQTYLHKVAAATRGDPADDTGDDAVEDAAAPAEDTTDLGRTDETDDDTDDADETAALPTTSESAVPTDAASADTAQPAPAAATVAIPMHEGRPGDVPVPEYEPLIVDGTGIRERWMRVQASFVDDPRAAVTAAAAVITDAAAQVETAVRERQQGLRDRWDGAGHPDTEALRVTMQQYRQLLERLAEL